MGKASISISDLVKVNVCTYWGWLNIIFDDLWSMLQEDLENIKTEDNKINVEWIGMVDFDDVRIDYQYSDDIWNYINGCFSDNVATDKLKEVLAKYGIVFDKVKFYKHKWEYNFAWDTLDMWYEYDDNIKWQEKYPELIPYVKNYIDNVRRKSCDWYVSFEPTTIDEVEQNDTTYIYAILDKEWMLDEVKKTVEDWLMECYERGYWDYDTSKVYLYNYEDKEKYDMSIPYYVDTQDKILRELKA